MAINIDDFVKMCVSRGVEADVIFEIGARECHDAGWLKRAYPNAEVYAFEAFPEEYNLHKDNVPGIKYYNIGMWSEETDLVFNKRGIGVGISSFRNRLNIQNPHETEVLRTTTVKKFCEENNITKIDILKLDVEGCSYDVFKGFGDILNTVKIMHIETEQEEYFENQVLENEVFALLEAHGFEKISHSDCWGVRQYDSVWIKP